MYVAAQTSKPMHTAELGGKHGVPGSQRKGRIQTSRSRKPSPKSESIPPRTSKNAPTPQKHHLPILVKIPF